MPSIKHKRKTFCLTFFILKKTLIFYNHQEKFYFNTTIGENMKQRIVALILLHGTVKVKTMTLQTMQ